MIDVPAALRAIAADLTDLADSIAMPAAGKPTGSPLERFLAEKVFPVPGASIRLVEFYETFGAWYESSGYITPTKAEVRSTLPPSVLQGLGDGNYNLLGNVSFSSGKGSADRAPLILANGRLRPAWGTPRRTRAK